MSFYALPGPGPLHATSEDERKARPLFELSPSLSDQGFVQAMSKRGSTAESAHAASINHDLGRIASPTQKKQVILDFSKIESDSQILAVPYTNCQMNNTTNKTIGELPGCPRQLYLKISVVEALVNFNKLCQWSSPCGSSARTKPNDVFARTKPRDGFVRTRPGAVFLSRRCKLKSRLQNRQRSNSFPYEAESIPELDPYERAMELELEIYFVGRKYATKRSFQELLQLRRDLQDELISQEQRHHQCSHKGSDGDCSTIVESDDSICSDPFSLSLGDASRCSFSSSGSTDEDHNGQHQIPDLPRIRDTVLGGFGCGFAQMNGMRRVFRAAVDEWFDQMLQVVPEDSPTLARFLWEPLSAKSIDSLHSDLTLGSIDESL